MIENKKLKFPSELRQEPVSKQWMVIATGRAKRPEMFKKEKKAYKEISPEKCPFCNLGKDEKVILVFYRGQKVDFKDKGKWSLVVVPNKFPALVPSERLEEKEIGPFRKINGAGYHELVITKSHQRPMALFSLQEIKEVLTAYQERYLALKDKKIVNFIYIFQNQGASAGASISHPHSQIITTPVSTPEFHLVLERLKRHYRKNKTCLYCEILNWERKQKKRIVFENKDFVVLCPFASRVAFEVRIYPKKHKPYFERIQKNEKANLAEAFKVALYTLYKGLNNPDYNFFLHTAPCDGKRYDFYHWHFVILPKTSISAGFELGAKIHVSTIEPEKAAQYLKSIKVYLV